MADDITPTELLIERLEGNNIEDVKQACVIFRKADGAVSYHVAGLAFPELLGLLRFVTLSIEHDLTKSWERD